MTIDEGALQLLAIARELAEGDQKKAAFMLLTGAICVAPNRETVLKAVNGMFDHIEAIGKA